MTLPPWQAPMQLAALLSRCLALVVAVSTLAALLTHDFYGLSDPVLRPGSYGQDIVSLAALPVLWWSIRASQRGELRAVTLWIGLLLYYAYGYLLYAFGPQLTVVYPLYIAAAGLSMYALVTVGVSIRTASFKDRLEVRWATWPAVWLFSGAVVLLVPAWSAMMIAAIRQGRPSPFTGVHVLDLAFVFPALIASALALRSARPWSYLAAGALLVKMALLMSSLVVAEVIALRSGFADPWPLALVFTILALLAGVLTGRYLRALGPL